MDLWEYDRNERERCENVKDCTLVLSVWKRLWKWSRNGDCETWRVEWIKDMFLKTEVALIDHILLACPRLADPHWSYLQQHRKAFILLYSFSQEG